jgi:integrase
MPDVHHQLKNGTYHVRFRLLGRQCQRSLHTNKRREADDQVALVRQTILALDRGHLRVPDGIDPVDFVMSGGRLGAPPAEEPRGEGAGAQAELTLRQAGEHYIAGFPPGSKEAETLATERTHLKHLDRLLGGDRPLTSLCRDDLQGYVTRRAGEAGRRGKVQRKTIRMELDTFRQVWDWASGARGATGRCPLLDANGNLAVNLPKGRQKEPFKTWDEVQAILARGVTEKREAELWDCLFLDGPQIRELLDHVRGRARRPWIFPAFCFAAYTGARISEICRAGVEDVQFEAGRVLIREKKKSRDKVTTRTVPLAPPLAAALREWLVGHHPGGPLLFYKRANEQRESPEVVSLTRLPAEKHFKLTLKGSKWEKLKGWHLFRHSFASNLAKSGKVGQAYIDELLGHTSEEMQRRYRHLFPDHVRNAVAVLSELYAAE